MSNYLGYQSDKSLRKERGFNSPPQNNHNDARVKALAENVLLLSRAMHFIASSFLNQNYFRFLNFPHNPTITSVCIVDRMSS